MNIPWICRHHCIYHVYTMYIPCILYLVYTMNIHCICSPQAYPWDIPGLEQMGLFLSFFIMICQWYTKYIQWIYLIYHRHIIIKRVQNKLICSRPGISQGYAWGLHIQWILDVCTMHIHRILMVYTVMSTYSRNIQSIYMVYTWYIHGLYSDVYIYRNILCIYHAYTWYLHGYSMYIMYISWCSTGRLMLRWRTGPIPPAPPAMTSFSITSNIWDSWWSGRAGRAWNWK